jgi:hypothetical protein
MIPATIRNKAKTITACLNTFIVTLSLLTSLHQEEKEKG